MIGIVPPGMAAWMTFGPNVASKSGTGISLGLSFTVGTPRNWPLPVKSNRSVSGSRVSGRAESTATRISPWGVSKVIMTALA